jgi:excisionase family DNA binding protein
MGFSKHSIAYQKRQLATLTVREVCELLRVSVPTLYRMMARGEIDCTRSGAQPSLQSCDSPMSAMAALGIWCAHFFSCQDHGYA